MDILTLGQYKTLTGIAVNNNKDDDQLNALITAANGFVSDFCNLPASSAPVSVIYRDNSTCKIYLESYPVASVDLVEYYYDDDPDNPDALVLGTDYFVSEDAGYVQLYVETTNPIRVTYTPQDVADLPTSEAAQLQIATQMLVDHWKKKEYFANRSTGVQNVAGAGTVSNIPIHIKAILNLHKRYVL